MTANPILFDAVPEAVVAHRETEREASAYAVFDFQFTRMREEAGGRTASSLLHRLGSRPRERAHWREEILESCAKKVLKIRSDGQEPRAIKRRPKPLPLFAAPRHGSGDSPTTKPSRKVADPRAVPDGALLSRGMGTAASVEEAAVCDGIVVDRTTGW